MLNSFPVSLAVGTVLGFLSGLGVGGGSLLILWLTMILGMDQTSARTVNLMFFFPAAAISVYYRRKQGILDLKKMLPAILAGCIGALLSSLLEGRLSTALLKKGFGLLLIATGVRELLYKPKNQAS